MTGAMVFENNEVALERLRASGYVPAEIQITEPTEHPHVNEPEIIAFLSAMLEDKKLVIVINDKNIKNKCLQLTTLHSIVVISDPESETTIGAFRVEHGDQFVPMPDSHPVVSRNVSIVVDGRVSSIGCSYYYGKSN